MLTKLIYYMNLQKCFGKVEKAGIVNSALGIVSALMKNKKGMHVGLEFKR